MAQRLPKQSTHRYLEVNEPSESIGLWSCHDVRTTGLTPIDNTRRAFGRFLNEDIERWQTWPEMKKAVLAKLSEKGKDGKAKSVFTAMNELASDYSNVVAPRWFFLWCGFSSRLANIRSANPPSDPQMFFGAPSMGVGCQEVCYHSSRTFFLRSNGTYFVAVVLKPGGTQWWSQIDKTGVTWTHHTYDRLIIDQGGHNQWSPILAEVIDERVRAKDICLFRMDDDALFKAVTDTEINPDEKFAHLNANFEFFIHDPNGPKERCYMRWSVFYNHGRTKYEACDRSRTRIVEVMLERKKDWASRQISVKSPDEAIDAARWVAENNGCIIVPSDASDEIRFAVTHALFYITFPERSPTEPGGLLRGYQLPGRMLERAKGKIRCDASESFIALHRKRSEEFATARRTLIVDTLLDRAVRLVASRNGLTESDARKRIEDVGGRAIIETAAWWWGFMEGNALSQFKPSPTAGSLKLPDLSLALGFEHRLGLAGEKGEVRKLVQTAPIRSLSDSIYADRWSRDVVAVASRMWTASPGKEAEPISYPAETLRILKDEGRYYLLAIPKYARFLFERDFTFHENEKGAFPVKAYRLASSERVRSRMDTMILEETYDFNKIVRFGHEGRLYLYSLDFGKDKWIADATYTPANRTPCRIIATVPLLQPDGLSAKGSRAEGGSGLYLRTHVLPTDEKAGVSFTFTFNPAVLREGRKQEGRSWRSYCDAHPEDANRTIVRWPVAHGKKSGDDSQSLKEACRKVIAADGVLLTSADYIGQALDAMGYVITQTEDPYAEGGTYYGYMLRDRVFNESDGRVEWHDGLELSDDKENVRHRESDKIRRAKKMGKPLAEVIQPETARTLEREWVKMIEGDDLTDKKTAKFFTLEAPIRIGEEFAAMVAREFRRVAYTGTMKYQLQIVRPAHEVAVGIWLARLKAEGEIGTQSASPNAKLGETCVATTPRKRGYATTTFRPVVPSEEQKKRLKTLDALLAEGLVTQEEYDAKKAEILGA